MRYNIINSVKSKGDDEMKKNKTLCKIAISIIVFLICSSSICFASDLPTLDKFKPGPVDMGTKATNIIVTILSIMRVLGVIALVIGATLIGFGTIIGSASQKAEGQGKYVGLVIAAVILIGGTSVAKMIIEAASTIGEG